MSQTTTHHQQNIFDSRGLLPTRHWKTAVVHMLLMVFVVFVTEISSAQADGLFDFQMKLAEKGNAEAQFKIGEMYETGFGTKKDMKLAEEWIAKAADQGHETASFKQLYWDMEKNGLTKTNKAKYDELVSKANAENAYAQYYVGKLYAEGVGVKQDSDKALEWFNKATLQGIVEAERESAIMREEIKRDELARQKAAQQRQAEQKAKREAEKRQQEAEARRIAAQKKAEAERDAKLEADKRNQASTKKSNDARSRQAQAAEDAKQAATEQRAQEARRKALLKQREDSEAKRKAEFESDPCNGKSARFLSTCR